MTLTLHDPAAMTLDHGYAPLKRFIIQTTGLAYYEDKDDDLIGRITRRLNASGQTNCSSYLQLLHDAVRGAVELDQLVEELTVGETSFFRHPELFNGLRDVVIPALLERNRLSRQLRIWSAGCSNGAEPYSIAILLAQEFGEELSGWDVSILGTDINRKSLARAYEGAFRDWDFRGLSPQTLDSCFIRRGDDWLIRPEYRRWVQFQYHNLVRHPSSVGVASMFDLIVCRNVLIYFAEPIMRQVIGELYGNLADGGWLLVGHAEPNVEIFRAFETVNVPGAVLYRKPAPSREATPIIPPAAPAAQQPTTNMSETPGSNAAHALEAGLAAVQQLADSGDLEAALRKCEVLLAGTPTNAVLQLRAAMLAHQLGDDRRARTAVRHAMCLHPRSPMAVYLSGLLEQESGRHEGAQQAYQHVLDLLAGRNDDEALPEVEHLIVADLREMVHIQQEALAKP